MYFNYETNKQCMICWDYSNKNNVIRQMQNFSYTNIDCKCNPTLHYTCLETWIDKTSSCPICRKKIMCNKLQLTKNNNKYFTFFCDLITCTFCVSNIIIITNLFIIIMVYVVYYTGPEYFEEIEFENE